MKNLIISIAILLPLISNAQVGNTFPEMKAESLKNEMINIPSDLEGKYTLICLAYSKKAEEDLKKWFSPVYNNFIRAADPSNPFAFSYDINTYFIPMLTGAKRPTYKSVMKKTKASIDPILQPNILFYEGTIKHYTDALQLKNNKVPYFYILNPDGVIKYFTSGNYTDEKMQEIVNAVESSLE